MTSTSHEQKLPDFKHFEDGQMFLCNTQTESECLERKLFASPSSKWLEISKITSRTAIFLYTLGHYPMVRGIFVAHKEPFFNCTGPFRGKFPAQVKVKWYHKFQPMPSNLFDFGRMFGGDGNRERKLSRKQTQGIIACFVNYLLRRESSLSTPIPKSTHTSSEQNINSIEASTSNSQMGREVQRREDYYISPHVLLYNGQLIPVYNPSGVSPMYMALPPVEGHESGIKLATHSQVCCIPYSKMSPYSGLQPVPQQVDFSAVAGKFYPIERQTSFENDVKNGLLHSQ